MNHYDVIVIGGGPGGLAAANAAKEHGASVLLIEREGRLGGILKQCIHDGFGVTRFHEKLTGPEYAQREIDRFVHNAVECKLFTFVTKITKSDNVFTLTMISELGVEKVTSSKLILATGCRERTSKQVAIHGTNPAGVMTAGMVQYYINILGQMPTKKCVILGSGDIGLIIARRITLEGGQVEGVYEIKSTPSGLSRNIAQCLDDFNIPLHLSHTVTRVDGHDRVKAVQVAAVDSNFAPIVGTERVIECDALILSVGLIPENEIAESLSVKINPATKGPFTDQTMMTLVDNVYSCGNSLHVSDLADFVSETGENAGKSAAKNDKAEKRQLLKAEHNPLIGYLVPSHLDLNAPIGKVIFYFRSKDNYTNGKLTCLINGQPALTRRYPQLKTPEMERLEINLSKWTNIESINFTLEVGV